MWPQQCVSYSHVRPLFWAVRLRSPFPEFIRLGGAAPVVHSTNFCTIGPEAWFAPTPFEASPSLQSGVLVTLVTVHVTRFHVSSSRCRGHWASRGVVRYRPALLRYPHVEHPERSETLPMKLRSKSWCYIVRESFYVWNFNTCKHNCSFEKLLYSKLLLVLYGDECIMW